MYMPQWCTALHITTHSSGDGHSSTTHNNTLWAQTYCTCVYTYLTKTFHSFSPYIYIVHVYAHAFSIPISSGHPLQRSNSPSRPTWHSGDWPRESATEKKKNHNLNHNLVISINATIHVLRTWYIIPEEAIHWTCTYMCTCVHVTCVCNFYVPIHVY